jgi:hypothetical protein
MPYFRSMGRDEGIRFSGLGRAGQQPAQRAEQRAAGPRQRRACVVSAQHGFIVTEHQDLDILGCVGSGEQRQPAQHAGEHQIDESKSHRAVMLVGVGCSGRGWMGKR